MNRQVFTVVISCIHNTETHCTTMNSEFIKSINKRTCYKDAIGIIFLAHTYATQYIYTQADPQIFIVHSQNIQTHTLFHRTKDININHENCKNRENTTKETKRNSKKKHITINWKQLLWHRTNCHHVVSSSIQCMLYELTYYNILIFTTIL